MLNLLWEWRFYLLLSILVTAGVIAAGYGLINYVYTNDAITQFQYNLSKLDLPN